MCLDVEKEFEGIPEVGAVDFLGCGGCYQSDECGDYDGERAGEALAEEGCGGVAGVARPVCQLLGWVVEVEEDSGGEHRKGQT